MWKKFVEKENITIKENQAKNIETLLCPEYDPVERSIVDIALTKIEKELSGKLRQEFMAKFPQPVDVFSPHQTLLRFKNDWINFVEDHRDSIDTKLAKKLDAVLVTNGDIRRRLETSGKKLDSAKSYNSREKYFVRVFNKLATRQLFEEVKETQETIDHYFGVITSTLKDFPPYVNTLFTLYPYHSAEVDTLNPSLQPKLRTLDEEIAVLEKKLVEDSV